MPLATPTACFHPEVRGELPFKCGDFHAEDVPSALQHAGDGGIDLFLVGEVIRLGIGLGDRL